MSTANSAASTETNSVLLRCFARAYSSIHQHGVPRFLALNLVDFVMQLLTENKEHLYQMCRGSKSKNHTCLEKDSHHSASYTESLLKCKTAVSNAAKRRDASFLRDVFDRHKVDARGGLSGQNLIQALLDADAPVIPDSEAAAAGIQRGPAAAAKGDGDDDSGDVGRQTSRHFFVSTLHWREGVLVGPLQLCEADTAERRPKITKNHAIVCTPHQNAHYTENPTSATSRAIAART
jgi:hypothetical protein